MGKHNLFDKEKYYTCLYIYSKVDIESWVFITVIILLPSLYKIAISN